MSERRDLFPRFEVASRCGYSRPALFSDPHALRGLRVRPQHDTRTALYSAVLTTCCTPSNQKTPAKHDSNFAYHSTYDHSRAMGDLSLRHIPDLSDASAIADFSDASFQIPRAADDFLLADDTIDFFNGADDTLATPAPPSRPAPQPPLTLAELTPRSKPVRAMPVRSSLRPRPGIATPHKAAVVNKLSAALAEDLSPFRHQDPSFQIPPQQTDLEYLLMADEGSNFFQGEEPSQDSVPLRARSPLTLSQLSPGPQKRMPLPSPTSPDGPSSTIRPSYSVIANDDGRLADAYERNTADIQPPASTVANVIPVIAEVLSAGPADRLAVERPAEKGIVKGPLKTNHAKEQKKLPGGDKAKRKKVRKFLLYACV